jgi:hypothetical protein
MVDSNLRPWLLEVNSPPQLHVDELSEADKHVKPALAKDMLTRIFHTKQVNPYNMMATNEIDDYDSGLEHPMGRSKN